MDASSLTAEQPRAHGTTTGFFALTIGSVGVVYGDIGTSPLYAFREALDAARGPGMADRESILGVLSLIFWSLIIVVTLKYVILLLRADNNGEGGTLSLTALAFRALGRRTGAVMILGMIGAAIAVEQHRANLSSKGYRL
jgi:KUP system potassium uptake protein